MSEEKKTIRKIIRDWVGNIGWRIFIWAFFEGDEKEYMRQIEEDVLIKKGLFFED